MLLLKYACGNPFLPICHLQTPPVMMGQTCTHTVQTIIFLNILTLLMDQSDAAPHSSAMFNLSFLSG